jgi:hypothetical protein
MEFDFIRLGISVGALIVVFVACLKFTEIVNHYGKR